jgi:hypothetical protein
MKAVPPGRCVFLFAILALTGCAESETIRITTEKQQSAPAAPPLPADQKKYRTLAAMIPADGKEGEPAWWFLKMSGPAAVIDRYQGDFDRILDSVLSLPDENTPIVWDLPEGWKQETAPRGGLRYATLKAPGGDAEIAVTRFGGTVLANAQRWWGELWGKDKGPELTAAAMPEYVRQKSVRGRLILRVDMAGPNEPPKRPMPMMMNPHGGQ